MTPKGVEMGWDMILDAIRCILAEYRLMARHGGLLCDISLFCFKKLVGATLH